MLLWLENISLWEDVVVLEVPLLSLVSPCSDWVPVHCRCSSGMSPSLWDTSSLELVWEVTIFSVIVLFIGWLKWSLSQSIGLFSYNPLFVPFLPGQRSDIFGNVSNHWEMVTYNFFGNIFFGSLIRACTGSFANVFEGTSPLYIKVGQILRMSKNGSWALVDARHFFFVGH